MYLSASNEVWAELSGKLASHPEEPPLTRSGVTLLKEEPIEWAQVA